MRKNNLHCICELFHRYQWQRGHVTLIYLSANTWSQSNLFYFTSIPSGCCWPRVVDEWEHHEVFFHETGVYTVVVTCEGFVNQPSLSLNRLGALPVEGGKVAAKKFELPTVSQATTEAYSKHHFEEIVDWKIRNPSQLPYSTCIMKINEIITVDNND
jgi:hypothetical protein